MAKETPNVFFRTQKMGGLEIFFRFWRQILNRQKCALGPKEVEKVLSAKRYAGIIRSALHFSRLQIAGVNVRISQKLGFAYAGVNYSTIIHKLWSNSSAYQANKNWGVRSAIESQNISQRRFNKTLNVFHRFSIILVYLSTESTQF